jgi:hypothetical protein
MPDQERIKTLEDGRKVKFIYQELPEEGAFIGQYAWGSQMQKRTVQTQTKLECLPGNRRCRTAQIRGSLCW